MSKKPVKPQVKAAKPSKSSIVINNENISGSRTINGQVPAKDKPRKK